MPVTPRAGEVLADLSVAVDSLFWSQDFSLWERCGEPSLFLFSGQAQTTAVSRANSAGHNLDTS